MADTSLLALDQFLATVHTLPARSEEQLRALLGRVSHDQAARQAFVEAFLPHVINSARSYASWCQHLDVLDLVQMGCEVLLTSLDRAMQHPDPLAYVGLRVHKQLLWLSLRHDSLIVTPTHAPVYSVSSLDQPVSSDADVRATLLDFLPAPSVVNGSEKRDFRVLYQALERLPQKQRELLARRYGLFDQAPVSLTELAREMYPDLPVVSARSRLCKQEESALQALKWYLLVGDAYTAAEIEQRCGLRHVEAYLRRLVKQGVLKRYSAPSQGSCGSNGQTMYVYKWGEVEPFLENWKPRRYVRRQSPASAPVPLEVA